MGILTRPTVRRSPGNHFSIKSSCLESLSTFGLKPEPDAICRWGRCPLLYSAVWGQALSDYPPSQCRCRSRVVLLFGIGTRALVWGFRCQGVRQGGEAFLRRFLGSISKPVSSSRPAHRGRRCAQNLYKVGCHPNLAACFALARPYLDSCEHDGTLMRSR